MRIHQTRVIAYISYNLDTQTVVLLTVGKNRPADKDIKIAQELARHVALTIKGQNHGAEQNLPRQKIDIDQMPSKKNLLRQ